MLSTSLSPRVDNRRRKGESYSHPITHIAMETAYVLLLTGEPDRAYSMFADAMGPCS